MPSNSIDIEDNAEEVHFHYVHEDTDVDLSHSDEVVKLNQKWQYDLDMEHFLRRLPKVELHVHLDGSFDPAILLSNLKINPEKMDSLPHEEFLPWDQTTFMLRSAVEACETLEEFKDLCTCRGKRSLHSMLTCFAVFTPIVRGDLDLIETLAFDFAKRQASQNVVYSEVRYSPHLLAEGSTFGGTESCFPGPVVDAVTRGLRRGEKEYGIIINQILCCIAWRPDWAREIVDLAHERKNNTPCAIVGIDIAAGEEHFDKNAYPHLHDPHYEAFQRAQELSLNVTMHAGEVGDASFVRKAVEEYGATRIGHGYQIANKLHTMEEMKLKNIHFETCPTSSEETGGWTYSRKEWKKHPAVDMLRHGLNVGFNSDDPAVFDTSLTWQYRVAVGKMGLTKKCILKSLENSVNSAFLSNEEKASLRIRINEYVEELKN